MLGVSLTYCCHWCSVSVGELYWWRKRLQDWYWHLPPRFWPAPAQAEGSQVIWCLMFMSLLPDLQMKPWERESCCGKEGGEFWSHSAEVKRILWGECTKYPTQSVRSYCLWYWIVFVLSCLHTFLFWLLLSKQKSTSWVWKQKFLLRSFIWSCGNSAAETIGVWGGWCMYTLPSWESFEPLEPTVPRKDPSFLVIPALLFVKICIDWDGGIDTGCS